MDRTTLIPIIIAAFVVGILARAIWQLLAELPEIPPETQDDFHASIERWGYLSDKRAEDGGEK